VNAPISARDMVLGQLGRVPTTAPRAGIEAAVLRFCAAYSAGDVAGRVALCGPSVRFEDPVGITVADGRDALEAFWTGLAGRGLSLDLAPERVIVVGDEALALAHMEIRPPGADPARLFLALHLTFDGDGLITGIRSFFDPACLS
jgi:ketosteroid isomerase-like protein